MKAHRSFRHEALLYRDSWQFLDTVVPFITDGIALKQPVMVAAIGSRIQAIRAALGDVSGEVSFVDMSALGKNPARIIPAWRRFVEAHGGGHHAVRGIGEPIWAGRRPPEIAECQLHEGLLNLAIPPDTPLWLMCPYDVHALDSDIVDEVYNSHPVIVDGGKYYGSTKYSGAYHVQELFSHALPEAPDCVEVRDFGRDDLGDVVNRVIGAAFRAGISVERSSQLAMAIREIADDAAALCDTKCSLRIWSAGGSVICEIHDEVVTDDPIVGRVETTTAAGRKGLWRANQVCDLIQVRSNDAGTVIRVQTWI